MTLVGDYNRSKVSTVDQAYFLLYQPHKSSAVALGHVV